MPAARMLGALAALCAGSLLASAPAFAARPDALPPPPSYPETLSTSHFMVHYTGELVEPPNPDRITQQQAGDFAAAAERAYDLFVTTWGYPTPKDDGDGKVDIWVQKQGAGAAKVAVYFDAVPPSSVWVSVDPSKTQDAHTAAWAVMAAIEVGMWVPTDYWLHYATSEWAAFVATDYFGAAGTLGKPDMSLDCDSPSCGSDSYEIQGESRWGFFQYLGERYGNSIVKDIFAGGAAAADSTKSGRDLVAAALAAKGTTLSAVFNDYAAAHVAGAYAPVALKEKAPEAYASISLTTVTSTLATTRVAINHLAARYVKLVRDVTNTGQCYAATLALTVTLPQGSTSVPSLYNSTLGKTALPFSVNGKTASLSVPWTTCPIGGDAYLAIPNPSLTADGQNFTVSGTLTVSNVAATQPSQPPLPAYTGPASPAPTTDGPPSVLVYGSEVVRVPSATRLLRLAVSAGAAGQLRVAVDGVQVGTTALRAGMNDINFVLPSASGSTLTLTALSPDGSVAGETVTRTLAFTLPLQNKPAQSTAKGAKKSKKKPKASRAARR